MDLIRKITIFSELMDLACVNTRKKKVRTFQQIVQGIFAVETEGSNFIVELKFSCINSIRMSVNQFIFFATFFD